MQFAFTAMFHYIFPPFSIGMGLLLVIYESLFLITKKKIHETITQFWIKIFADTDRAPGTSIDDIVIYLEN